MICKFCGLNNADDAAFCSRCGSPLQHAQQPASNFSSQPVSDEDKKTVRMNKSSEQTAQPMNQRVCKCGYPILPGMQECPLCHTPVVDAEVDDNAKKTMVINNPVPPTIKEETVSRRTIPDQEYSAAKRTETFVESQQEAKRTESCVESQQEIKRTEPSVYTSQPESNVKKTERFVSPSQSEGYVSKKTVNIYQQPPKPRPVEELPHFTLEPIKRDDEMVFNLEKCTFDTPQVVLNRQNTDPENSSITSRQQAIMSFEDGKWYIEDRSSFKTTFIRVTKKTELQEGDIIVLGDRAFKFSKK
jgi:hypothetical protein